MKKLLKELNAEEIQNIRDNKTKVVEMAHLRVLATNKFQCGISEEFSFLKNDIVIGETDRGGSLCIVLSPSERVLVNPKEFPKILMKMSKNHRDFSIQIKLRDEARKTCLEKIADRGLPMKLVDVEIIGNKQKIVFYFTAEGRIDFRELVKDLAKVLKTRIEMRQIGVRDESKMLGGIGPCGLPLCCASFIRKFETVNIKMAKIQGQLQNPQKITGVCGRLMCCLNYEYEVYKEARLGMPKIGSEVETPRGKGIVKDINPLRKMVKIQFPDEKILFNFKKDEISSPKGDVYKQIDEEEEILEEEKLEELKELEKE